MKKIVATAILSTLIAGSAFAQSANAPSQATDAVTTPPAAASSTNSMSATDATVTPITRLSADQITSSKIVGKTVYNTNNEKVGEVNDLILGADGKVAGVVIGVGGFLGMGERNVALTYSSLKITKDSKGNDRFTIASTKDQLKAMAPYDTSKTNG